MLKSLSAKLFAAGTGLFGFFVIFSYLVDTNKFRQADFDTTVRVQNNIPRTVDDFFSFFSVAGHFEVLLIVLLIMVGFFIWKRKYITGFLAFSLFGIFHVIEIIGKNVVENIPPPEFLLRTKRLIEFPQFHVRSDYSYPSGHSGRTIFLSVLFIFLILKSKLPLELKIVLILGIVIFDCMMLLTRVYLGEHWTTDVIGGALLGASFALISLASYERIYKKAVKDHHTA